MAFKLQRHYGFGLVYLLGATGSRIKSRVSIAFQRLFVQLPFRLVQFTFWFYPSVCVSIAVQRFFAFWLYSVCRRPNVHGRKELPVLGLGRVFV